MVQAVVTQCGSNSSNNDNEMIQGLLNLDFVYDIIPPEILMPEPVPDWYINFMNSDREPAIQTDINVDPPLSFEGKTWEEYCSRNNLVEETPMSDNEPLPQSDNSDNSIELDNIFQPVQNEVTMDEHVVYDLTSNDWQSRRKIRNNGLEYSWQHRSSSETELLVNLIPEYFTPKASIRSVHAEFPLPKRLYNLWKDGIRLWPKCSYAKDFRKGPIDPINQIIVDRLVKAGICEVTTSSPFCSSMFYLLNNNKTSLRPIFNYGHLTKYFTTPHFNLPSVYQVIDKYNWQSNMYYVKLDFSQAFFNINIHNKSKYITNIKLGEKYYKFNYMPFGMSLAPFVCQQILNSMMRYIRKTIKCAWGHIDDIIIAHEDGNFLRNFVKSFLYKLSRAHWVINAKKSILNPVKEVMFLGAIWGNAEVIRNPEIDKTLSTVINSIKEGLSLKETQQIRGYLNYYLSFAGKIHSIVNRALLEPNEGKQYLYALMEHKKIKFRDPDIKEESIYTDATINQLGWCNKEEGGYVQTITLPIIYAETLPAMIGIYKYINNKFYNINLITDNMATFYFIKKGTAGFLYNLNFYKHFLFVSVICKAKKLAKIKTTYINTKFNPADKWSRMNS